MFHQFCMAVSMVSKLVIDITGYVKSQQVFHVSQMPALAPAIHASVCCATRLDLISAEHLKKTSTNVLLHRIVCGTDFQPMFVLYNSRTGLHFLHIDHFFSFACLVPTIVAHLVLSLSSNGRCL